MLKKINKQTLEKYDANSVEKKPDIIKHFETGGLFLFFNFH